MRVLMVVSCLAACSSEKGIRVNVPSFPNSRPLAVETPSQSDRIVQVPIPQVDALFVVDNSCSMLEEQEALGTNFPAFLQWFAESELDYHIGVVSTDMNDPLHTGQLQPGLDELWIEEDTAYADAVFADMVSLGIEGHPREKGRAAAFTAVELLADKANAGFVRRDAGLHITIVSDEDDDSGSSPITRDEFVEYLLNARQGSRMVSFSSIVGPRTGCAQAEEPGTDYLAVTSQVGGVSWPICSPDWTTVLEDLGFLAAGLSREFFLSRVPVPGTVEVKVQTDGVVRTFEEGTDWAYVEGRNSVEFVEYLPPPLAVVLLDYDILAGQASIEGRD